MFGEVDNSGGKPSLDGSHKLLDLARDYSFRRKVSSPDEAGSKALFLNTTVIADGSHHKFEKSHREPRLIKKGVLLVRDRSTEEEKVQQQTNFIPGRVSTANTTPLNMVRKRMLTSVPQSVRKKTVQTSQISFRPRNTKGPVFLRDYDSQSSSSSSSHPTPFTPKK